MMGPAYAGGEGWLEGWVNELRSGILCCHLCCWAEWLTACLSAQRAGMIGSWPTENGAGQLYIYTYITAIVVLCMSL